MQERLRETHKKLARGTGMISIMLAIGKASPQHIRTLLADLREAVSVMEEMERSLPPEKPPEAKPRARERHRAT